MSFGAAPSDWSHFDLICGIGCDLLPVVSRIGATPSPGSRIKAIGKVPSVFNDAGQVVGIPRWTAHSTTPAEIARWSTEGDYGICIQTRTVRALDVDIDAELSEAIGDFIQTFGIGVLPMRMRPNSDRCLFAFEIDGDARWSKRVMRTSGGAIEFLANGQQFVAVGTHPSGARYEWCGGATGLPDGFPVISAAQFEALWAALAARFATEPVRAPRDLVDRVAGLDAGVELDEVGKWLTDNDLVVTRDGARLDIICPFFREHTDAIQGAESSTSYFLGGSGGFEQGHFRCLHAHCEHRSDGEFLQAVGYIASAFDVVDSREAAQISVNAASPSPSPTSNRPLPAFSRDANGEIFATVDNVARALRSPWVLGHALGHDAFRDDIMLSTNDDWDGDWRVMTDVDMVRFRLMLERVGFKPIGRELMRDAVMMVADDHRFDSAANWLNGLRWDGVPRVDRFAADYLGARGDAAYLAAVSRYLWTALAGRVLDPGCKADMVPILVGAEGARKSSAVAAIAPAYDFTCEVSFADSEVETARKMRGTLVAEINELRGLGTRDAESIRAFITRRYEKWTPKYREFSLTVARRTILIGTTNSDEFLSDGTHRRWLPFEVERCDTVAIERDREQLWSEASALWLCDGVDWEDAERLARGEHSTFEAVESWEETIVEWLDSVGFVESGDAPAGARRGDVPFSMREVLCGALNLTVAAIKRTDELRVGKILRKLGFEKRVTHMGAVRGKRWIKSVE